MKNIKLFESFVSNIYNFYKLVKMLRGWETKYTPDQYDKVISDAFNLINSYNLKPGKLSPSFTLPIVQLELEFIKKFFKAAEDNGYKVVSNPSKKAGYMTFNFIKK